MKFINKPKHCETPIYRGNTFSGLNNLVIFLYIYFILESLPYVDPEVNTLAAMAQFQKKKMYIGNTL